MIVQFIQQKMTRKGTRNIKLIFVALLFNILRKLMVIVCLYQPQYHILVPAIPSILGTYKQELMFTSTLSYHKQLFNGINYLFLTLTRLTIDTF